MKALRVPSFHDQKNLFKTIQEVSGNADWPDWVHAHIYALDGFLWFMARHGYTLQKTRTKLPFDDIEATLHDAQQKRQEVEGDVLKQLLRKPAEQ